MELLLAHNRTRLLEFIAILHCSTATGTFALSEGGVNKIHFKFLLVVKSDIYIGDQWSKI